MVDAHWLGAQHLRQSLSPCLESQGPCRVVLNQFDWISRVSFAVGDDFESGFHDRRRERPNLGTFLASELFNRPSASLCNELVEVPQACIGIS